MSPPTFSYGPPNPPPTYSPKLRGDFEIQSPTPNFFGSPSRTHVSEHAAEPRFPVTYRSTGSQYGRAPRRNRHCPPPPPHAFTYNCVRGLARARARACRSSRKPENEHDSLDPMAAPLDGSPLRLPPHPFSTSSLGLYWSLSVVWISVPWDFGVSVRCVIFCFCYHGRIGGDCILPMSLGSPISFIDDPGCRKIRFFFFASTIVIACTAL